MPRIIAFLKRPSSIAFICFAAAFAAAAGYVFNGAWAMNAAPLSHGLDHAVAYPHDSVAAWWRALASLSLDSAIPGDVHFAFGSPYFWSELEYAIHLFFAALGTAYYLKGRGVAPAAAYGGGLAFAFSGYALTLFSAGHMGWFELVAYMPFAFGLADRAVRKGRMRHWALFGAVAAWGAARQPDIWMLFAALAGAYAIFAFAREAPQRRAPNGAGRAAPGAARFLAGAAVAAAVFAITGMPQFVNAFSSGLAARDAQISAGTDLGPRGEDAEDVQFRFCTGWSMPPEDILEIAAPGVRGDSSDPHVSCAPFLGPDSCSRPPADRSPAPYWGRLGGSESRRNWRQHSLYVGAVTVSLAFLGVAAFFAARRGKGDFAASADMADRAGIWADVPFWAVCAVVALVLSLGSFTPVYKYTVYQIPLLDKFRAPVKFHHVTEFCLAILSGYGLHSFFSRDPRMQSARKAGAFAAWALAAALVAASAYGASCAGEIKAHVDAMFRPPPGYGVPPGFDGVVAGAAAGFRDACLRGAVLAACAGLCAWAARKSVPRGFGAVAVAALVAVNVCDLAANGARYLVAQDVTPALNAGDGSGDALLRDVLECGGRVFTPRWWMSPERAGFNEKIAAAHSIRFDAAHATNVDGNLKADCVLVPFGAERAWRYPGGWKVSYYRQSFSKSGGGCARITRREASLNPKNSVALVFNPSPPEREDSGVHPALKAALALSIVASLAMLGWAAFGCFGRRTAAR